MEGEDWVGEILKHTARGRTHQPPSPHRAACDQSLPPSPTVADNRNGSSPAFAVPSSPSPSSSAWTLSPWTAAIPTPLQLTPLQLGPTEAVPFLIVPCRTAAEPSARALTAESSPVVVRRQRVLSRTQSAPAAKLTSPEVREKKRPLECRPATWAGKRYPANASALSALIRGLMMRGSSLPPAKVIMVPHTPMEACGSLLACAFKAVPRNVSTIVIVGPSHKKPSPPFAVTGYGGLDTPMGVLAVDVIASMGLRDTGLFHVMPEAEDRQEHCVEALLPFVRLVAPNAMVIPIIMGDSCPPDQLARRVSVLASFVKATNAVILASCDMTQCGLSKTNPKDDYTIRSAVTEMDMSLVNAITTGDPEVVSAHPYRHLMCRHTVVSFAMRVAIASGCRLRSSLVGHTVTATQEHTFQGHAAITFHRC
eukprot:m51a1_g10901 hypothetical protein (423) ;mRNA; f:34759-36517